MRPREYPGTEWLQGALACAISLSTVNVQAENPVEDMRATVRTHVIRLGDNDYFVRQGATQQLILNASKAMQIQNPLPSDVRSALHPRQAGIEPEQQRRLEIINEHVIHIQNTHPGRIQSPKDRGCSLRSILEEQFSRKIYSNDPTIEGLLNSFSEGTNGLPSAQGLALLCQQLKCFPIMTSNEILLEPMKEGDTLRANDHMIRTTRDADGKRESKLLYMPDTGAVLTAGTFESNIFGKTGSTERTWTTANNQFTPGPDLDFPDSGECAVILAVRPETGILQLQEGVRLTIGPQEMRIGDIQENDGKTEVEIDGWIFVDVPWPKTSVTKDMMTYQLVASNSIQAINQNNEKINVTTTKLEFEERRFLWKISMSGRPKALYVRCFEDLEERKIVLP